MELCLVVEHACNLRCTYCYTGLKSSRPMTQATARAAARMALARSDGALSVTLFGGEPLLVPRILERVEAVVLEEVGRRGRPIELRWLVDTNATLVDAQSIDWLRRHPTAEVLVSMDGPAHVHDRHRVDPHGQGTHARVLENYRRLKDCGVRCQLVAVVTAATAPYLGESVAYLLGLAPLRLALQPHLRDNWTDEAISAFRQGALDAAGVWAESFRAQRPVVVEPLHTKVLSHLTEGAPLPARCQIATREFTVAPSGRIYPCAEMVGEDRDGELAVGHVEDGLSEGRIRALRARARATATSCATCALSPRCQYRCACRQLASSGRIGTLSPAFCEIETAWVDAADAAAERLTAENCRAFQRFYYELSWGYSPGAIPPERLTRRCGR
jgi:uncharacterized protein